MNSMAIIFQRGSVGTSADREEEAARLNTYAEQNDLTVVAAYVASGEPNMLTVDMLINHCMAREKPGHVLVAELSRIWVGEGTARVVAMVGSAGAIVHVVPPEAT